MADINFYTKDEFINSIENPYERQRVERDFWVRDTTLDYCYSIPEYQCMSREMAADVYDTIHEIVERLASAYSTIMHLEKELEG